MLDSMFGGLVRLNTAIIRVCEVLISVLLGAIVVALACSVFWRYFLNSPIVWSEDFSLLCLVWMTLLGAPIGMRGGHIAADFLLQSLPGLVARWVSLLTSLGVLFVALTIVIYGIPFVKQGMARIVPSIDWLSFGYVYLSLPVGFALLLPLCVEGILRPFVALQTAEESA